jgi:hypothetical protein
MNIRIIIPYKIFGVTIWTRRYRRFVPSAWSAILDGKRRLLYVRMLSILPFEQGILHIARDIMGMSRYHFHLMAIEDIAAVVEKLEWMRLDPLATPIFYTFSHKKHLYALPRVDFTEGIAYEFALADNYYQEWTENPEESKPLLQLVATFCRPVDIERLHAMGDGRAVLNTEYAEHQIEFRAKLFEDLDFAIVIAVLRYFEGVKQMVHDFGTSSGIFDKPSETPADEPKKNGLFGWWTAFRSVAKTQNKTEEAVWSMALWRVLAIMIEEKHRADEMEKQSRMNEKN